MSVIIQTTGSKKKRRLTSRPSAMPLHFMILPGVILALVYYYLPILGNVMAFQRVDIAKGLAGILGQNKWIGFDNFKQLFLYPDFYNAFRNTVVIALMKIVLMIIVPIIFALLINEVKNNILKKTIQTVIYLPHFLSWVILGGVIKTILSVDGPVNYLLNEISGANPIFFLGQPGLFRGILVSTHVWQEFGFSTIIYLAAIVGIDPSLYESAIVDGAGRLKQTLHITLPGMKQIIVLMMVLSLGGILNAGFDQVFNLYSVPVYEVGDIIDTLVYRLTFENSIPRYGFVTSVGLFKNVISFIFVSASYWLAYRFANYEIF